MKRSPSLRQRFNAVAAALALTTVSGSSVAIDAQAPARAPAVSMLAAQSARYVPYSATGEQCPAPSYYAPEVERTNYNFPVSPREQQRLLQEIGMNIGRETPDGIFRERTIASINEFRNLYYGPQAAAEGRRIEFSQSFTASELADLRTFSARVQRERRAHKLTLEAAVALRFAAHATDSVHANLVGATNKGRGSFEPTAATWLYLVKNYGHRYGLHYFAEQITTTSEGGKTRLSVADPVTLQNLLDMRNNQRLNVMMQAEHIKNRAAIPAQLEFKAAQPPMANLFAAQQQLGILGFNVGGVDGQQGPGTDIAIAKYRILYGPLVPQGANVDDYLPRFAELAQADAREHSIPTTAAAAIRLASLRTGADFGYMMELSSAESTFDHTAQAGTSSALGLYQFTEDTWIQTINRHGAKYGMEKLADQMEAKDDMNGILVGRAENPFVRVISFDLRTDPHLAALMSAEFQMRNKFLVECSVGRELGRTDQYLGHFLGARGAAQFLNRMSDNPGAPAASAFPQAADANRSIFYSRNRKGVRTPRSLTEVYNLLGRKFDRDTYEDTSAEAIARMGIVTAQMRRP